ncbi:hypothetical protein NDU88_007183 [Pleurodeles waltl]|uniref:Uncharacterized protein n=1 Tax=Pleurodeles waltl TaxID=8319 RepID=A0AAV7RNP2_PLEWA|nr:hypothetical protein NDU88_007183 [Pleurodeles waltl]
MPIVTRYFYNDILQRCVAGLRRGLRSRKAGRVRGLREKKDAEANQYGDPVVPRPALHQWIEEREFFDSGIIMSDEEYYGQGLEMYGPYEDEDYYFDPSFEQVIDSSIQKSLDKAISSDLVPLSKKIDDLAGPSPSLPSGDT